MYQFSEQIKTAYVEHYVDDDYREAGDWLIFDSVYISDTERKMGMNLKTGWFNCFKTGEKRSFLEFVKEHEGLLDRNQAEYFIKGMMRKLKIKGGFKNISYKQKKRKIQFPVPLEEHKFTLSTKSFLGDFDYIGEQVALYLLDRGLDEKHINKFDLSYSDDFKCEFCHGTGWNEDDSYCQACCASTYNRFYKRIIIPTYEKGKLVYYQGRSVDDDPQYKYLNSNGRQSEILFFFDLLKEGDDIYVTEGPFDAMTLYDYSTTCLMGHSLSDQKIIKLIYKRPNRVIFCPDWDKNPTKRADIWESYQKSFNRFKELSKGKIPLYIYKWYEETNHQFKDINEAGLTRVNEDYFEEIK